MAVNATLKTTVDALMAEGNAVLETRFDAGEPDTFYSGGPPTGVELRPFAKWRAGCLNLVRMLGQCASPWASTFDEPMNSEANATRMVATLEAIAYAMANGLLIRVEDLVRAEAFDSLLGQADYLLSQGYYLAAGVVGRAVLEEHLRSWCDIAKCTPFKANPTVNDFKDGLYKGNHMTLTVMKHVESLAAVGNDAAHNKATLNQPDVERLLRDVRDFIAKHP